MKPETDKRKVVKRLEGAGWIVRHGAEHDIYTHPSRPNQAAVVPRHRTLTLGVARSIAKAAGWKD